MLLSFVAIISGFVLLIWSADRFVGGASATAKYAEMPPLLIGMVVVGFGTSAPEIVVSALAAMDGHPNLALGNAYGSNITNIGLVLGLTAVITPLAVHSKIIRKELPLLLAFTLLSGWLLWDGKLTQTDAALLLISMFGLLLWSIISAKHEEDDDFAKEIEQELSEGTLSLSHALFWLMAGLFFLVLSSHVLVWGAVNIAQQLGVSDLIIGLTIVALGTSLPELAATLIAARKGEHDIALGNIIGSCMFNLLAVVGIAGAIAPISVMPEILNRDWPLMLALIIGLLIMAYGFRHAGRINRFEGMLLLSVYIAYNSYLGYSVLYLTKSF